MRRNIFDFKLRKFKNIAVILFVFIFFGLVLRLLFPDKITFFYDQARDAFESINIIINKDIKILGPRTDIAGLFHGPLYWYLLSPVYYLTQGNVLIARIFLITLSLINIPLMYYFAYGLFRNRTIALLSSFLFAVSFEAVQYSRWLSNPSPAILTTGLFFYGLWIFIQGYSWGFPLLLLALGLSIQFQFFLLYLVVFLFGAIIYMAVKKKKMNFLVFDRLSVVLYGLFLLSISSFIISELKFKFRGIKALLGFFLDKEKPALEIFPLLLKFIDSIVLNIQNNLINHKQLAELLLIGLFFLIAYCVFKKRKYTLQIIILVLWFVSPIILYFTGGTNAYFLNIGNTYPLIMLVSFFLYIFLFDKKSPVKKILFYIFILIITFSNILQIVQNNKHGETLFAIQYQMLYPDQQAVTDWIYKDSNKKQFAVNSVTNPLFINTTWSFHFNYYGKKKYGYMPAWLGYPQHDYPGGDVQFGDKGSRKGKLLYLIIEPSGGIPLQYIEGYIRFEDLRSKLIERKKIKNFIIEKRELFSDMEFSREKLFELITIK